MKKTLLQTVLLISLIGLFTTNVFASDGFDPPGGSPIKPTINETI